MPERREKTVIDSKGDVEHEVEQKVAEERSRHSGKVESQLRVLFEVAKKSRVEEEFNQQLLKVVEEPVVEFSNTDRGERTVAVSQNVITAHADNGNKGVCDDAEI